MNKVKVLFFATLQARAGTSSLEMDLPANVSVRDFKAAVNSATPSPGELAGVDPGIGEPRVRF